MIRHLLKIVWHRKRMNALLILEIFVSFLVVFAVATSAILLLDNYRKPTGFRHENVWSVRIDVGQGSDETWSAGEVETFARLLDEARAIDGVERVAGASDVPYDGSTSRLGQEVDGRNLMMQVTWVTDGFGEVMGMDLDAGRFFQEDDAARSWAPVVVNRLLARDLFGEEDPVGQRLPWQVSGGEARVVGVLAAYRKSGEFSAPVPYLLERVDIGDPDSRPPRNLVLRMRPGTDPRREEEIVDRLQAVARSYNFEVRRIGEMRETYHRLNLAPVLGGGLVAGFLMLMVGLGLIGVLWQNVTQRTGEIGLRRATGARGGQIRAQILGELWILTALGLALGIVLLVQLPLLDLVGFFPAPVFAAGIVLASGVILLLATLSGLYPSWLATRVQPAEALHYE